LLAKRSVKTKVGSLPIFSLLREKIVFMRVSVRNMSNACVSRKMRESLKVCYNASLVSFFKKITSRFKMAIN
jgi:hypothetical protein